MADPLKIAPVPNEQTLIGEGGKITRQWADWLLQLKLRAEEAVESGGGAGTIDASQITSGIIALARISGLTDAQIAAAANIAWSKISKAGSSLADLSTRSAADLTSGLLALARGGTNANLSATGGSAQFLKQLSAGAAVSVAALLAAEMPSGIDAAKIADGSVSNTEFQYLDGLIANIQEQLYMRAWKIPNRKWFAYFPWGSPTSATGQGVNLSNATITASSHLDVSTTTFYGFRFRTGTAIGNAASVAGAGNMAYTVSEPVSYFRLKTGADITSIRFFLGLTSAVFGNADTHNLHYVAFRYSTVASDPGWVGVCCNGTAANAQTTGNVANIAADTEYLLKIRVSGGGAAVHFSVSTSGGAFSSEQSLSTNLPSTTTKLLFDMRLVTQVAAAREWIFNSAYVELQGENLGQADGDFLHNLLSVMHPDTTPASPVNGDLVVAQSGSWARRAVGSNNQGLVVSGGLPTWSSDVPLKSTTNAFTGANSFATNPIDLLVGQIKFPATANPSSDANTLDDYEEGTWTPVLTCATPGDLSVTYAANSQFGSYVKIGRLVYLTFFIVTSNLTQTTAAGNVQITGLPFTNLATDYHTGGLMQMQGITKATYTMFAPRIAASAALIDILAGGSGVNAAQVVIGDVATGAGNIQLIGSISCYAT